MARAGYEPFRPTILPGLVLHTDYRPWGHFHPSYKSYYLSSQNRGAWGYTGSSPVIDYIGESQPHIMYTYNTPEHPLNDDLPAYITLADGDRLQRLPVILAEAVPEMPAPKRSWAPMVNVSVAMAASLVLSMVVKVSAGGLY